MRDSSARRLVHSSWLATAMLWVGSLGLIAIDRPADAVPPALLGLPMATYGALGGLVARRRPENPIGWIFGAVAVSLALWMFGFAYAQVGLGDPVGLGAAPGAAAAAWIGVLAIFLVPPLALPAFLLFFPDGHLRSRRWRAAIGLVAIGGALIVLGVAGEVHKYAGAMRISSPELLANVPGVGRFVLIGFFIVSGSAFVGLASLVLRFRSSSQEERQPIRLLVAMIIGMAVATVLAIVIVVATGGADWSWLAIVAATLVDGFGILIGIPLATAAAVLTYGLYDVGVVVKKTVVYVLLVIVLLLLLALVSLIISPVAFMGVSEPGAGREAVLARLVSVGAVFSLAVVLLFRPIKRLARRMVYGRRSTPYEVIAEFSERLGETYATDDVLPRMAEVIRASTGADVVRVWLHVGHELRPVAEAPAGTSTPPPQHAANDELPRSDDARAFPVRHRGEMLGALTLEMPASEPLSKTGEQLVVDVASQAGLVLSNVRLIEDLRTSRQRIVTAQDERARALERNIHDGAQQQLVALAVKLRLADSLIDRDVGRAHEAMTTLQAELTDALENLRDLARGIYPPLLADKGLTAALEAQARKSTVPVIVRSDSVGRLGQDVEAAVYFCCLEALQNVVKYANASSATISIARSNGSLRFRVTDDGDGFDLAIARSGSGLQGMEDRLSALGGTFEISSEPGHGASVIGTLPVAAEESGSEEVRT